MPKGRFSSLFKNMEGGEWELATDAPDVIEHTVDKLEKDLNSGETSEPLFNDFSNANRDWNYEGRIAVINISQATIFFDEKDGTFELLAIAVSEDGPLNADQVSAALDNRFDRRETTPAETVESKSKSDSLRSIRQSYEFITGNTEAFLEECDSLKRLLRSPKENREEIYDKQAPKVERELHNLLSSVWTFQETIDASLKDLDIAGEYNPLLQKYQDKISAATGLRHCIQHGLSLRINWLAHYSHEYGEYQFSIVVPLPQVDDEELYDGKQKDAGGDSYSPPEYFYGDIERRVIDLEELTHLVENDSSELYQLLREELTGDFRADPSEAKKRHVLTSQEFFSDSESSGPEFL